MPQSPAMVALAIMLGLAVAPLAMTAAKSDPQTPDSDKPSAKSIHPQRFTSGSCHDLGYAWQGIAFPILPKEHRQQPVTAYICQRDFQFAPHDWP